MREELEREERERECVRERESVREGLEIERERW